MMNKRFSGVLGEEYDLFNLAVLHHPFVQESVGKELEKHFAAKQTKSLRVLEIGPGTGITTREILKSDPRVKVVAVDNERKMIVQLKKNLSNFVRSGRVKVVQQDILSFLKKCKDHSFDGVASAYVIHNWHHRFRSQVLRELYRVLKEGAIFVNADKYSHADAKARNRHIQWQLKQFDVYEKMGKPELKKEWVEHYLKDNHPDIRMIESDAVKEMKKIGFAPVKRVYRKRMEAIIIAGK